MKGILKGKKFIEAKECNKELSLFTIFGIRIL